MLLRLPSRQRNRIPNNHPRKLSRWDEENYINHFTLNHWTKCNCNCTYCYTKDNKKAFNAYKEYPLYPIIKDMFKKGVIKKAEESCIIFGGGEPTILKDFDKLINLFLAARKLTKKSRG